jgi:hypothetical protein
MERENQAANQMRVPIEAIVHTRLKSWANDLIELHATPVLLVGVGHDENKGQIQLCTCKEVTNEQIRAILQAAIRGLDGDPEIQVIERRIQ